MRIAVAGLGIIGASLARAFKKYTDHRVDGWNRTRSVSDFAVSQGYIDGVAEDFSSYDVVFVALPPAVSADFILQHTFRDGATVADICGMKKFIQDAVARAPRNFDYVGTHPMAGKETAGIESSTPDLFCGANIVLIDGENTRKEAFERIKNLYLAVGAGQIIVCDADYHDAKIAYTSQLPHVLSNAYVKTPTAQDCFGFTGGSFQDMSRVAAFNENIWTELFFLNKENLLGELNLLISNLQAYRDALEGENVEQMKTLLREGSEIRRSFPCGKDKN